MTHLGLSNGDDVRVHHDDDGRMVGSEGVQQGGRGRTRRDEDPQVVEAILRESDTQHLPVWTSMQLSPESRVSVMN